MTMVKNDIYKPNDKEGSQIKKSAKKCQIYICNNAGELEVNVKHYKDIKENRIIRNKEEYKK